MRILQWSGYIWVTIQAILIALILGAQPNRLPLPEFVRWIGAILGVIGLSIVAASAVALGTSLSVFPKPKSDSSLITTGLYALVRHPIYTGVLAAMFGYSLYRASAVGIVLSFWLLVFFDRKAHVEEQHLRDRYPEYEAYRARTKKLIPFIY